MKWIDEVTPKDVRYVLAVFEEGNLARAAERLGVTQSALTYAVRRVEERLAAPLFVRSSKGMHPTTEAHRFATKAGDLLRAWATLAGSVRSSEELEGTYSLACHPTVGLSVLPRSLPALLRAHPGLNVTVDTSISREVQAAVAAGRVDFGVVVNPARSPDLVVRRLGTDRFLLWKDKRLGKARRAEEDRLLFLDPDLFQSQRLFNDLDRAGFKTGRAVRVRGLDLVASLASEGGYGLLPARVASRYPTLREVEVDGGSPERHDEFALAYRDVLVKDKSALRLARELEAAFKRALAAGEGES